MTGFEGFVVTPGETLAVSVVMLVVMIVTVMIVVVRTNVLLVVVTMCIAMLVVAIVVPVALIRKVVNLVVVALCHFVAEFGFSAKLDLFLTLLYEQAVGYLRIEDILEVLDGGLEFLL